MPVSIAFDIKKYPFLEELLEKEVKREVGIAVERAVEREVGKAVEKAVEKVREEGREEGRRQRTKIVELMLEKRYGRLPASVRKRVAAMSDAQAQEVLLAMLDATSLADLFEGKHQ